MDTGKRFAVKMIELANPSFDLDALCKEIDTMQRIDHPNCIHLHDIFVEEKYICLVMDLVTGGELFDRIISRGRYSEKDAAEVKQLSGIWHTSKQGANLGDTSPGLALRL
jgi:serine/threonine protein kinase